MQLKTLAIVLVAIIRCLQCN